jgi:hypothetical protein
MIAADRARHAELAVRSNRGGAHPAAAGLCGAR